MTKILAPESPQSPSLSPSQESQTITIKIHRESRGKFWTKQKIFFSIMETKERKTFQFAVFLIDVFWYKPQYPNTALRKENDWCTI